MPSELLPQTIWKELHELQNALKLEDVELEIVEAPWSEGSSPDQRLAKMIIEHPCRIWILYRTSERTQAWFRKNNILAIVRGVSYPSVHLPYIDTHWQATAKHAATTLYQKGHRCAGLCVPDSRLFGNILMKQGFLSFKAEGWTPVIIAIPTDAPGIYSKLEKTMKDHPEISALVSTRARMLIAVRSWLADQKLVIPDDISLISLVHEPYINFIHPPLSCYRHNAKINVRKLIQMMFNLLKGSKIRSRLIIPELKMGKSVKTIKTEPR